MTKADSRFVAKIPVLYVKSLRMSYIYDVKTLILRNTGWAKKGATLTCYHLKTIYWF